MINLSVVTLINDVAWTDYNACKNKNSMSSYCKNHSFCVCFNPILEDQPLLQWLHGNLNSDFNMTPKQRSMLVKVSIHSSAHRSIMY